MQKIVCWLTIVLTSVFIASGCASTCKRVASDRKDFLERSKSDGHPHMLMAIPLTTLNQSLIKPITTTSAMRVPLPNLNFFGMTASLGAVEVQVQRIEVIPARKGYIGLQIGFGLMRDRKSVASMYAVAEVKPQIDIKTGSVRVALQPKDIASLRPYLPAQEQQRIVSFLYAQLPSSIANVVSRNQIAALAKDLSNDLLVGSWPKLRDGLLAHSGPISQFAIDLPNLPITRMDVQSQDKDLVLFVYTSFAAHGLGNEQRVSGTPANLVQVRLTGEAMAALVNHAIASGKIPARYNEQGQPDPNGSFAANVDWIAGRKPLKLHAWSVQKDCAHIIFAGTPKLSSANAQVVVAVDDASIERTEGSARVRAGIWFSGLGRRTFQFAQAMAGTIGFEFLNSDVRATVTTARVMAEDVVFGLTLAISHRAPKRS